MASDALNVKANGNIIDVIPADALAGKSQKEKDHLERSTKKVKSNEETSENPMAVDDPAPNPLIPVQDNEVLQNKNQPTVPDAPTTINAQPKSFKEAFNSAKKSDVFFNINIDLEIDDEEGAKADTANPSTSEDPKVGKQRVTTSQNSRGYPKVELPQEVLKQLRQPWENTLIIKLLGKTIGYNMLLQRVRKLWALQTDFKTIDLGANYFLLRFDMVDEGPSQTIKEREPDFKASEAMETTTAVWVRFPELPIEYYQDRVLYAIAKCIGKPLKVDLNTAMAARGRFARVCVEVDLNKPLFSRF